MDARSTNERPRILALIAEDDELVRRAIQLVVRWAAINFVTARDGREAIERVQTDKPDIVLLDLLLPEVDGVSVLRQLRSNPATQHIPVIVVSVMDDEATRREVFELGVKAFLSKPFEPNELIACIEEALKCTRERKGH